MKNADMPAMPFTHNPEYQYQYSGLTKREHFAAMLMQGLIANAEFYDFASPNETASAAVAHADALLAELEKIK